MTRLSSALIMVMRFVRRITGLRTWHIESAVVIAVLVTVVLVTGRGASHTEWLGAIAVYLTFGHASVSFRLSEAEERRSTREVECYRKLKWYYYGKEMCWLTYFVLLGLWSPLVGVGVFLFYPYWRNVWIGRPFEG